MVKTLQTCSEAAKVSGHELLSRPQHHPVGPGGLPATDGATVASDVTGGGRAFAKVREASWQRLVHAQPPRLKMVEWNVTEAMS